MRKFIIDRQLPAIGSAERQAVREAAQKSNATLKDPGPDIQWVESYVAADKTFCVYLAKDEAITHEHARRSGFPADKVTESGGWSTRRPRPTRKGRLPLRVLDMGMERRRHPLGGEIAAVQPSAWRHQKILTQRLDSNGKSPLT